MTESLVSSVSPIHKERINIQVSTPTTTTPNGVGNARTDLMASPVVLEQKTSACTPTITTHTWNGLSGSSTSLKQFIYLDCFSFPCHWVYYMAHGFNLLASGSSLRSSAAKATSVHGSSAHSLATLSSNHSFSGHPCCSVSFQESTSSAHSYSDGGPTSTTFNTATSYLPDQPFQKAHELESI